MAAYPNIFEAGVSESIVDRIEQLKPSSQPQWGKMNAGQMLAHLNVAYDMETGALPVNNNFFVRWMLKTFVKNSVVGDQPYKKNSRTAPAFLITEERDFMAEKTKLIDHIQRVKNLGPLHYDGKKKCLLWGIDCPAMEYHVL